MRNRDSAPKAASVGPATPATGVERARSLLIRAESPLLIVAALGVAIYLADLAGLWLDLGLRSESHALMLTIDVLFVIDLVGRVTLLGRSYRRSPWIVIDFFAAAPIIASIGAVPGFMYSLRFLRGFRILRALRALRLLRALPGVGKAAERLQASEETKPLPEVQAWHRALVGAVVVYAVVFVALLALLRGEVVPGRVLAWNGAPLKDGPVLSLTIDDGHGQEIVNVPAHMALHGASGHELALAVGALLGMGLVLFVVRYQIPAVATRQFRALLNVALPHQVAEHFLRHPEAYNDTERTAVTVVFCDIHGFTNTVEALGEDLDTVKHHLERAMEAVVEEHSRHDLIVDKFIGDAIMSFRGGRLVAGTAEDHALRVVQATLAGAAALRKLNDPYFTRMKVGGASSPRALVGAFGTSNRFSYTVLGDRVNLAARLEGSCGALGVQNMFCDRTRTLCGDGGSIRWRALGLLAVQGKEESVDVHEAFDPADPHLGFLDTFAEGLAAWRVGNLDGAEAAFTMADAQRAEVTGADVGDGPSRSFLRAIAEARVSKKPFDPVLRTRKG